MLTRPHLTRAATAVVVGSVVLGPALAVPAAASHGDQSVVRLDPGGGEGGDDSGGSGGHGADDGTTSGTGSTTGGTTTSSGSGGGGGDRVEARGGCRGGGTEWKLKVKPDDGRLEVEGEVDSGRTGQRWAWKLRHNGSVTARGTGRTSGPSGSFDVERMLVDLAGTDTVKFRATYGGQVCRGVVHY